MKEIDNQDLLNSIENYVQYLVITYNGKELKKGMHIYTYIYIYMNHFAVYLKLTQFVNQICFNKKFN